MKKVFPLPEKFKDRMAGHLGGEFQAFEQALQGETPVSVRLNPAKPLSDFESLPPVPWCAQGRYLPERPAFVTDPLIFAGHYYVQEASSMFLCEVLRQKGKLDEPLRVLDLCAAPGGKSTLIASLLNEKSYLVSNEIVSKRVNPLVENLVRWGLPHTVATNNNPQHFEALRDFFDVVVVDAPCSGEGMFRKDYKAIQQWSEHLVATCAIRQKNILESAVACLKPGGRLIYSTCTFAESENEENLQWLIEKGGFSSEKINLPEEWGIVEVGMDLGNEIPLFGYRFYPHRLQGEGFFMTCLTKQQEGGNQAKLRPNRKGPRAEKIPSKFHDLLTPWLQHPACFEFLLDGEQVFALPQPIADDFSLLYSHLRVRMAGVMMGKFKSKKFLPGHELAMSVELHPETPSLLLGYEQAMQYLSRLDFEADTQGKTGWLLIRYRGTALGWVKALPNRINNYYPMELRIRKDLDFLEEE